MAKKALNKQSAEALKKKRVDLAGNTLKTTEEEIVEAKGAQGAGGDALAGVEKPEESKTEEVVEEKAKAEEKPKAKPEKKSGEKSKKADEVEMKKVDEAEEVKTEDADDANEDAEEADESTKETETEEETEEVEEKKVEEEVKSEKETDEVKEGEKPETEEVEETKTEETKTEEKEAGDLDARMTKVEDTLSKMLAILTKADELKEKARVTKADEAEEKSEEAEKANEAEAKTEEASESEKSDKSSDIQKADVQKSTLINKLEGQLEVAQKEVVRLKKQAKPSKLISPLAVAKGFEWVDDPKSTIKTIEDKLGEIDKIKKETPHLFTEEVQKEAFRLVKVKKDILYQMS